MSAISADDLARCESLLSEARREPSPLLARGHYRSILKWIEPQERPDQLSEEVTDIASRTLADLATMESSASKRLGLRLQAIAHCRDSLESRFSPVIAIHLANRTVDLFYDHFAPGERVGVQSALADAIRVLDKGITSCKDSRLSAGLFVQKSSCLRCQGLLSKWPERIARATEAVRCAERAIDLAAELPATHMEHGQALWANARWETSDDQYASALNRAEQSLRRAQSATEPLSRLVLARFFRLTYRPAEAVDTFVKYVSTETNKRRQWNETFLYGEAAMQLWYNGYDKSLVAQHLTQAHDLLREAIDAGYENARNFTVLALVNAALGRSDTAEQTLRKLGTGDATTWLAVVREAMDQLGAGDVDAVKQGWALGLTDSSVWNSLGTYAREFLGDQDLAIQLYEFGRQLGPRNAVVLTNLARALTDRAASGDLEMADEHLRQAARCADRGFVWWRDVRSRLDEKRGVPWKAHRLRMRESGDTRVNRKELVARLEELDRWTGQADDRGREFQQWFIDLLRTTPGVTNVRPGYHLPRLAGSGHPRFREVDAAFRFGQSDYRAEVRWHKRRIGPKGIDDFFSRLRTPGVTGLFLSMSGFTDGAVDQAWELLEREKVRVLLMHGSELRDVVGGRVSLQMLLETKERHLSITGRPYVSMAEKSVAE